MFPHQIMKKLEKKKIMWAPMYDALNFRNSFLKSIFWKQISNLGIKVLEFSDKLASLTGREVLSDRRESRVALIGREMIPVVLPEKRLDLPSDLGIAKPQNFHLPQV